MAAFYDLPLSQQGKAQIDRLLELGLLQVTESQYVTPTTRNQTQVAKSHYQDAMRWFPFGKMRAEAVIEEAPAELIKSYKEHKDSGGIEATHGVKIMIYVEEDGKEVPIEESKTYPRLASGLFSLFSIDSWIFGSVAGIFFQAVLHSSEDGVRKSLNCGEYYHPNMPKCSCYKNQAFIQPTFPAFGDPALAEEMRKWITDALVFFNSIPGIVAEAVVKSEHIIVGMTKVNEERLSGEFNAKLWQKRIYDDPYDLVEGKRLKNNLKPKKDPKFMPGCIRSTHYEKDGQMRGGVKLEISSSYIISRGKKGNGKPIPPPQKEFMESLGCDVTQYSIRETDAVYCSHKGKSRLTPEQRMAYAKAYNNKNNESGAGQRILTRITGVLPGRNISTGKIEMLSHYDRLVPQLTEIAFYNKEEEIRSHTQGGASNSSLARKFDDAPIDIGAESDAEDEALLSVTQPDPEETKALTGGAAATEETQDAETMDLFDDEDQQNGIAKEVPAEVPKAASPKRQNAGKPKRSVRAKAK